MIVHPLTCKKEEHMAAGQKTWFKIENLTPRLSEDEYLEQQRIITEGLYKVFSGLS